MQAQSSITTSTRSHLFMPEMDAAQQDVYTVLWGELKHTLLEYNQASEPARSQIYTSLKYRLRQLNDLLEDSADYLYALHLAQHSPTIAEPWMWTQLADDGDMQLGLLAVEAETAIPLHNHPGQCGADLVLSGRISVDQFDNAPVAISADYPIVKLEPSGSENFQMGQAPIYTCDQGNVLRLQTDAERAVLLSIKLRCSAENQACWYYPISPESPHHSFFAKRLTRLTNR